MSKENYFFHSRTLVSLLMIPIASFLITVPAHSQFVHTDGTSIKDATGQDIYFKGINLGNWLLWEGYLMMDDTEFRTHSQFFDQVKNALGNNLGKAINFEHEWRENYVTEHTISSLKGLGFNSVRVPFHFNMFWDYNSNAPRDHGFQYIDDLVEYCRTHGVYILLDMHAAPGYQNPGDHSDNGNSNASQPRNSVTFWDGNNVDIASQVWKHIADHYKDEPMIWGYDLINEPVPQHGREYELLGSMKTMRDAIRQVDDNHIIVAEGSWWGSELDKLDWRNSQVQQGSNVYSKWDNNLVYQIHHYDVTARSSVTSGDITKLNNSKNLCNALGVPMMMGEYGENTFSWIQQMTNWCENNDVHAFPWAFKKVSHDKTLWKIEPNGNFNALKNHINQNTSSSSNSFYNSIINFCENDIKNGNSALIWDNNFYNAINIRRNCSDANAVSLPGTIRAFNYCDMNGVGDENSTDVEGGRTIGWVDSGDWLDFKVNVLSTGIYNIKFRASGNSGAKSIQLRKGSTILTTANFQANGWQWGTTTTVQAYLTAGIQTLRVHFPDPSVNLNWIEFQSNSFVPDPLKTYYIDCIAQNERIASSGESESPYTTNRSNTGIDTKWRFLPNGSGSWFIDRAAGGTIPRLRSDDSANADMHSQATGTWEYFNIEPSNISNRYYITLPNGPNNRRRLQVNSSSNNNIKMVSTNSGGSWVSFTIIEASGSSSARFAEESVTVQPVAVELTLYPNPTTSQLKIKGLDSNFSNLIINGLDGRQYMIQNLSNAESIDLDISQLEKGIYFLRLFNQNGSDQNLKFIKE